MGGQIEITVRVVLDGSMQILNHHRFVHEKALNLCVDVLEAA